MTNDFGVTFAPTADQAELAKRRQGLEGVPQALQILSLHMPRFLGAQAPVNSALTSPNAGAQGIDPYLSAVLASIARTLGGPGLRERPERPAQTGPNPLAPYSVPGIPPSLPSEPQIPAVHWQPAPGQPPRPPSRPSYGGPQGAPQNFRRREFGG